MAPTRFTTQIEEAPGPVQGGGAGPGALESGGDKTKPFVQNAVTTQEEGDGSSAPPRPAAAVPAGATQSVSDGGLVS